MAAGCREDPKPETTTTTGDVTPTCGHTKPAESGGTGGAGTGDTGGTGGMITGPSLEGRSLALSVLRLGDTDLQSGEPSVAAWKDYGFNLDGKDDTTPREELCQIQCGAKQKQAFADGTLGIDNSFGANILPILLSLASDIGVQTNDAIHKGQFSLLVNINGIQPNQTGTFLSRIYVGQLRQDQTPAWNGMDAWPVRSDSLVGGEITVPRADFPAGTVSLDASGKRVWQSVGTADLQVHLPSGNDRIILRIHHARLSMILDDNNEKATRGMIGGVLDTEELVGEAARLAGQFAVNGQQLCPGNVTFEAIANQLRQASDILVDGTQDPNVVCNGISIGLGFDAESAGLGKVFDPDPPFDPCKK